MANLIGVFQARMQILVFAIDSGHGRDGLPDTKSVCVWGGGGGGGRRAWVLLRPTSRPSLRACIAFWAIPIFNRNPLWMTIDDVGGPRWVDGGEGGNREYVSGTVI